MPRVSSWRREKELSMKVLIVYAHPNPKSFNHAILETAKETLRQKGDEIKVVDLYSENLKTTLDGEDFGKIMAGETPADVRGYQNDILWAEKLVFIFPVWWWSYPAVLKGWIDRVFLMGFAYVFNETGVKGLLKNEKALVFMTTGGPEEGYKQSNTVDILTRQMSDGVMKFCGVNNTTTKIFYGVPAISDEARKAMLEDVKKIVAEF
jgi:NAD(P)H dehydrogenase (quinone)